MRHYEIFAAGSIPYFIDIDDLPERTMVTFPKKLVKKAMSLPGMPSQAEVVELFDKGKLPAIDWEVFDMAAYEAIRAKLLEEFEKNCLTRTLCSMISPPRTVTLVSRETNGIQDYVRDFLIMSLLENGHRLTTNFPIDFLFEDWSGDPSEVYGRGMTYTRSLPPQLRSGHTISNSKSITTEMVIFSTKSNAPIVDMGEYSINSGTLIVEVDGNDLEYVDYSMHRRTNNKYVRELSE